MELEQRNWSFILLFPIWWKKWKYNHTNGKMKKPFSIILLIMVMMRCSNKSTILYKSRNLLCNPTKWFRIILLPVLNRRQKLLQITEAWNTKTFRGWSTSSSALMKKLMKINRSPINCYCSDRRIHYRIAFVINCVTCFVKLVLKSTNDKKHGNSVRIVVLLSKRYIVTLLLSYPLPAFTQTDTVSVYYFVNWLPDKIK